MKAPLKKTKASTKKKAAPTRAKKSVKKKTVRAKAATKSRAAKAPRKNEATAPAPSLFLNPEVNPGHSQGHRRINLKENPVVKPGRSSAR
jgi:hypothetical protein